MYSSFHGVRPWSNDRDQLSVCAVDILRGIDTNTVIKEFVVSTQTMTILRGIDTNTVIKEFVVSTQTMTAGQQG